MNLQEKLYLQVQAAERLVADWRKDADDNKRRSQNSRLAAASCLAITAETLRQCAKELEEALR